jgi:hypothetical protein
MLGEKYLRLLLEFEQSIRFLSILASCYRVAGYLQNQQEMKEIIGVGPMNADSAASTNQKEGRMPLRNPPQFDSC